MAPAPGGSGRPERAALLAIALSGLAAALFGPALPASSDATRPAADAALLFERADRLELAEHPSWRALLHYERRWLPPGSRSAARSPELFLDERGHADARAELEATLRGLLDPKARSRRGEPVRCSFPARELWLKKQLGVPDGLFPEVPCPELAAWRKEVKAEALTIVFPEAYMDSPASMFGHTLLRLDPGGDEPANELLGHAIDFTADSGGEQGPIYLIKGVSGRYPARFGLNPFWEKLKQYADWQNRDLWEYPLDLTREEIELVVLHLWELRDVEFPYWFFDENCSYHLVRVLQVARPEIEVTHGFPISVMPIDTVRDVIDPVGTSGPVDFRPSPATRLRHAMATLPRIEVGRARALADGVLEPDAPELAALPDPVRARILGLAYDTLRFRFLDEGVPRDDARKRAHRLLLARSRLGRAAPLPAVPKPATRPDRGHGSAMAALAGGVEDDRPYLDLRIRPALHDRLDPTRGHSPDATIRVLDATVRWYPALRRVRFHELVALEIRSEPPIDRLASSPSWHFDTGLRTRLRPRSDGDLDAEPVWRSEGGVGVTFAMADELRFNLFAELRAETGGSLDRGGAFGPGIAAQLALGAPDEPSRLQFGFRAHRFLAGDVATVLEGRFDHTMRLGEHFALVSGFGWNRDSDESWLDGRLELRFYY